MYIGLAAFPTRGAGAREAAKRPAGLIVSKGSHSSSDLGSASDTSGGGDFFGVRIEQDLAPEKLAMTACISGWFSACDFQRVSWRLRTFGNGFGVLSPDWSQAQRLAGSKLATESKALRQIAGRYLVGLMNFDRPVGRPARRTEVSTLTSRLDVTVAADQFTTMFKVGDWASAETRRRKALPSSPHKARPTSAGCPLRPVIDPLPEAPRHPRRTLCGGRGRAWLRWPALRAQFFRAGQIEATWGQRITHFGGHHCIRGAGDFIQCFQQHLPQNGSGTRIRQRFTAMVTPRVRFFGGNGMGSFAGIGGDL